MNPIRVSIIEYANTVPFVYGISQNEYIKKNSVFLRHYPSLAAQNLQNNIVDISLVPVAAISEIPHGRIISDFCIASQKQVASVLLCSHVPISQVTSVKLDYQSRTSNILVQIIAKKLWSISPRFLNASTEDSSILCDADVLIGDKALMRKNSYAYVYDIASAWYELFDMPCLFACWLANKNIPQDYLLEFQKALSYGVAHVKESIIHNKKPYSFDLHTYLTENIMYTVPDLEASLRLFYSESQKDYIVR